MLQFTGDQGRQVIDTTYPPLDAVSAAVSLPRLEAAAVNQVVTHRGRPQAIQAFDTVALVGLASRAGAIVEVVAAVGDIVTESAVLLRVYGGAPIKERQLLDAIHLGQDRTFDQDPKYALRLLVDIAIRALSPAVNDPTTAVQALDQIGDLLYRLGRRRLEISVIHDEAGQPRLVLPSPTWEDFLQLAFDEIRSYGGDSVQVVRRMKALITDLTASVPEERRPALAYWQRRLSATVTRRFAEPDEQLDASAEDRQGLGAPRRRSAEPA